MFTDTNMISYLQFMLKILISQLLQQQQNHKYQLFVIGYMNFCHNWDLTSQLKNINNQHYNIS